MITARRANGRIEYEFKDPDPILGGRTYKCVLDAKTGKPEYETVWVPVKNAYGSEV